MASRGKTKSTFDTSQYDDDRSSDDDETSYVESGSSGEDSDRDTSSPKTSKTSSKPKERRKRNGKSKKRATHNARTTAAVVGGDSSSVTTTKRKKQKKGQTPARVSYGVSVGAITSPTVGDVSVLSGLSALETQNNGLREQNISLLQQVERMKAFMVVGGGGGKSAARTLKKRDFMKADMLNVKVLNSFIATTIWPKVKIMPKNWHVWDNSPKSACSRMLGKVTVPDGMTPQMYWKEMLCVFANDKLCATRANFKMSLLQRYKGMCVCQMVLSCFVFIINTRFLYVALQRIAWKITCSRWNLNSSLSSFVRKILKRSNTKTVRVCCVSSTNTPTTPWDHEN